MENARLRSREKAVAKVTALVWMALAACFARCPRRSP